MKKTYMQPMVMIYGLEASTLLAGSGAEGTGNAQASYGSDATDNESHNNESIGTVGDNDTFTQEAKKYQWGDWGE